MPWRDWQFWVVSAAALGALWFVLREVAPVGPWKRKKKGKAASLTVEGKAIRK